MSREEKQHYLRESIMNDGLDTEKFINFMESDPDRGADLDQYDLGEIKNVIGCDAESARVQGDIRYNERW